MSAHPPKAVLTPDRVRWFAEYRKKHRGWGLFHTLERGGTLGVVSPYNVARHDSAELNEAADYFDSLTPSQRRRLRERAEDLANTIVPGEAR